MGLQMLRVKLGGNIIKVTIFSGMTRQCYHMG